MKNPFSLQSRRAAPAYIEGLRDVFRLTAKEIKVKKDEKNSVLKLRMKYIMALPLVQPSHGPSLPPSAMGKYIAILHAEKDAYDAGVKRGESIKPYLEMV